MCFLEHITPEVKQTSDRNFICAPLVWTLTVLKVLKNLHVGPFRVSKHQSASLKYILPWLSLTLMDSLTICSSKSSKTNQLRWYKAQLSQQLTPSPCCTSCSPSASRSLVSPSSSSLFHRYRTLFVLSSVHWSLWFRDLEIWGTVIWLAVTASRCGEQTMAP